MENEGAAIEKMDEKQELEQFLIDMKNRFEQKLELRKRNLNANNNRPDETFFRKLDSNLKKNTAFVKKVKNFTESQKDSIIRDFSVLNLSKYVAELANSVAEAKLKISDVPSMVELCSLAHQRYAEFSSNLLDFYFKKTFPKRKDDQISNLSKFRVDLRLLADLITVGVFVDKDSLSVLGGALNYLVQSDKEDHANLPLVITFCKYCGEDYANLVPKQIRQLAEKYAIEIPQSSIFTAERQKNVINLLNEYYSTLTKNAIEVNDEFISFLNRIRIMRDDFFVTCFRLTRNWAYANVRFNDSTIPKAKSIPKLSSITTKLNLRSINCTLIFVLSPIF